MAGAQDAAGLKIILHDQGEVPVVKDMGLAIPTGTNAFIGVKLVQVRQ